MKANYEKVVESIIRSLENGTAPWRKPWRETLGMRPRNAISKKPYRGFNVWALEAVMETGGYTDPRFLTFKQAKGAGGSVRKGETGHKVMFWQFPERVLNEDTAEAPTRRAPLLRVYTVFNVAQCDGLELPELAQPEPLNPGVVIGSAQGIVDNMPHCPVINWGFNRAAYLPSWDKVEMPNPTDFESMEAYYATLFHELAHSTGHAKRLNREGITNPTHFGSNTYGKEELVAELTSSLLCAEVGIDGGLDQSAAYLSGWLKAIQGDNSLIVTAAGAAQRAADYILNLKENKEEEEEEE